MTELQDKSYILWFSWLGEKLLEWSTQKPANREIRNCIKATREIGIYVNQLQTELIVFKKRNSLMRADKNNAIERARKSEIKIQELEQKLKNYELLR